MTFEERLRTDVSSKGSGKCKQWCIQLDSGKIPENLAERLAVNTGIKEQRRDESSSDGRDSPPGSSTSSAYSHGSPDNNQGSPQGATGFGERKLAVDMNMYTNPPVTFAQGSMIPTLSDTSGGTLFSPWRKQSQVLSPPGSQMEAVSSSSTHTSSFTSQRSSMPSFTGQTPALAQYPGFPKFDAISTLENFSANFMDNSERGTADSLMRRHSAHGAFRTVRPEHTGQNPVTSQITPTFSSPMTSSGQSSFTSQTGKDFVYEYNQRKKSLEYTVLQTPKTQRKDSVDMSVGSDFRTMFLGEELLQAIPENRTDSPCQIVPKVDSPRVPQTNIPTSVWNTESYGIHESIVSLLNVGNNPTEQYPVVQTSVEPKMANTYLPTTSTNLSTVTYTASNRGQGHVSQHYDTSDSSDVPNDSILPTVLDEFNF